MKGLNIYQDPTLNHVHAKLAVYFIICILLGIFLSIVFPCFDDNDEKINRLRRNNNTIPTRVMVRSIRALRSTRRKAA